MSEFPPDPKRWMPDPFARICSRCGAAAPIKGGRINPRTKRFTCAPCYQLRTLNHALET
jgi:hypothetical protein